MKKSKLEIYALAVCFVTIVCAAISLGFGIYSIIEIYKPDFTITSYIYERHQTNESFFNNYNKDKANLSEEEKTKRRLDSYSVALKTEARSGAQSLVRVFIILAIDIIVFIIHWVIAMRARETNLVAG